MDDLFIRNYIEDLLKNVIAGIALQTERPFEIGHWVEINKQIGRVVEMSWRATRVITVDGNRRILNPGAIAIDGANIVAVDTPAAIASRSART